MNCKLDKVYRVSNREEYKAAIENLKKDGALVWPSGDALDDWEPYGIAGNTEESQLCLHIHANGKAGISADFGYMENICATCMYRGE